VELFQRKVKSFPEESAALVEYKKETAARANESASRAVLAAVAEHATTNVIAPALDTVILTKAVSDAEGPPLRPSESPAPVLAKKLEVAVAKLDSKVNDYKEDVAKDAGKKIEGTGTISMPYLVYVGLILLGGFVLFTALKLALTVASAANPGAAVGLGLVNASTSLIGKGLSQVIKGGEEFKDWVKAEVNDPALQKKILSQFRTSQLSSQDQDVQELIKKVTS